MDKQKHIDDLERQFQHEFKLEEYRALLESGATAIKSAFILNGGAAIAFLAYAADAENLSIWATMSMYLFCSGGLLAALSHAARHMAQYNFYYNDTSRNQLSFWGNIWNGLARGMTLGSMLIFWGGIFFAANAIVF